VLVNPENGLSIIIIIIIIRIRIIIRIINF